MFKNFLARVSCAALLIVLSALSACVQDYPTEFCYELEADKTNLTYWAFETQRLVFVDKDSGDIYDFEFYDLLTNQNSKTCTQFWVAPNSEYQVVVKGRFYYNTQYYQCQSDVSSNYYFYQDSKTSWVSTETLSDMSEGLGEEDCVLQ